MDMPDGFIPLPPRVEPQAAFRPLLDDLRRTLARPPFERAVHSVYLYGSVARGEAITGRSDLDLPPKLIFWVVAVLVLVALGFPYVMPFFY